jgi:hypothetical protein
MKPSIILFCLSAFLLAFVYAVAHAEDQSAEDWFNDDSDLNIDEVNEGDLKFIKPVADKRILHSEAILKVTEDSLDTGMVGLQQCYRNLDPVPEMEVVFDYKNIEQLQITSIDNVGNASLDGQSVQLKAVSQSASVCISAQVQVLEKAGQDTFILSHGPYYRRFLDGFYPYHISVSINFPESRLKFVDISPQPEPLFDVVQQPGKLFLDTWFEGVLLVEIRFSGVAGE